MCGREEGRGVEGRGGKGRAGERRGGKGGEWRGKESHNQGALNRKEIHPTQFPIPFDMCVVEGGIQKSQGELLFSHSISSTHPLL